MRSREYHCLVAGLPDIFFDDAKLSVSMLEFKALLTEELHPDDYELIKLFFYRYDNENILLRLKDESASINPLGNLTPEDIDELFIMVKEGSYSDNEHIPEYLGRFIEAYRLEEPLSEKMWEIQLSELYFEFLSKSKNNFISKWFAFEKNLSNIITAANCRKYDYSAKEQLIGEGELVEKLTKSNAKDFGISYEFPKLEEILKAIDDDQLMDREKRIDYIKWNLLDDETFFFYFTIEKIFSYLIKISIIERWLKLHPDTGKQMFNELLNTLETSYTFPEEFTI